MSWWWWCKGHSFSISIVCSSDMKKNGRDRRLVVMHAIVVLLARHNEENISYNTPINSLRPRRDRRHFADDIFKCIFLNGNVWISINISLKVVPKGPINNIPALVEIMAWRRPGDKPLSEPRMVNLPTHICVTRPQWVKRHASFSSHE